MLKCSWIPVVYQYRSAQYPPKGLRRQKTDLRHFSNSGFKQNILYFLIERLRRIISNVDQKFEMFH